MPKKQRNRDKIKAKKYQPDPEKVVTQATLNNSKEILDQIEVIEYCKICYIDYQLPLIQIIREGKKDIITHKFNIGKPNVESQDNTTITERNKTHHLAPTKRDPCHESRRMWKLLDQAS